LVAFGAKKESIAPMDILTLYNVKYVQQASEIHGNSVGNVWHVKLESSKPKMKVLFAMRVK